MPVRLSGGSGSFHPTGSLGGSQASGSAFSEGSEAAGLPISGGPPCGQAVPVVLPGVSLTARFTGRSQRHCSSPRNPPSSGRLGFYCKSSFLVGSQLQNIKRTGSTMECSVLQAHLRTVRSCRTPAHHSGLLVVFSRDRLVSSRTLGSFPVATVLPHPYSRGRRIP